MAFEKMYVGEEDATWQQITTDEFYQDLEGYYKDTVSVGIELIAATPQATVRTPWAIYRFMDECKCEGSGSWIDEDGKPAPCPYCEETEPENRCSCVEPLEALKDIYHAIHFYREGINTMDDVMKIEGIAAEAIREAEKEPNENLHGFHTPRGDWADRPTVDPYG